MSESPAHELPSAGHHGSGSAYCTFYKVEVRSAMTDPTVIPLADPTKPHFVIDNYWREWPVGAAPVADKLSVPIRPWDREALNYGLLSYVVAMTHAWGLLASLEAGIGGPYGSLGIEIRLVAVKLKTTYATEELGVVPIDRERAELDARVLEPPTE